MQATPRIFSTIKTHTQHLQLQKPHDQDKVTHICKHAKYSPQRHRLYIYLRDIVTAHDYTGVKHASNPTPLHR
jgi:hypothetical protein